MVTRCTATPQGRDQASAPRALRWPPQAGFSLVEISVVLVVLAVLATLAVPSFLDQLAHSRRSDARSALQSLQWQQERYYQAHGRYAPALADLRGSVVGRSAAGHYRMELLSQGPEHYVVVAHAEPSQARDRECPTLALQVRGAITERQPSTTCWAQ